MNAEEIESAKAEIERQILRMALAGFAVTAIFPNAIFIDGRMIITDTQYNGQQIAKPSAELA